MVDTFMNWTTRDEPVNETTASRKLATFTVTPSATPLLASLMAETVPLEIKILGVTVQCLDVGNCLETGNVTPNVIPPTACLMERTVSPN